MKNLLFITLFFVSLFVGNSCKKNNNPKPRTPGDIAKKMNGTHFWHGTHTDGGNITINILDTFDILSINDSEIIANGHTLKSGYMDTVRKYIDFYAKINDNFLNVTCYYMSDTIIYDERNPGVEDKFLTTP